MSQSTSSSFLLSVLEDDDVSTLCTNDLEHLDPKEQVRACIVTLFPPDSNKKWLLPETYFSDLTILQNWCGQFEIGGHTDKLHCHIWCEFKHKHPRRFTALLKIFSDKIGKGRLRIIKPYKGECAPETRPTPSTPSA